MEQRRRDTIAELARAGKNSQEIRSATGYAKSTVNDVLRRLSERGDVRRKPGKTRSDCKRTKHFLASLKQSIERNPTTPQTKLAKKKNVSRKTIQNAIKDLGMVSRARTKKHILTKAMMNIRLERCKKILASLKHLPAGTVQFFSDEKIFTVDQAHNRRNDRWISKRADEVKPVMTSKHPAQVMVLELISSDGDIMPPHFFGPKEKITKEVYVEVLKTKVVPWMEKVAAGRPYLFQQDSAPAHKSKMAIEYLTATVPHFWTPDVWPSNSPDLNPCDFFLWGRLERMSNATPHNSISSLKAAITKSCKNLPRNEIARAVCSFRNRVKRCIEVDGGHVE